MSETPEPITADDYPTSVVVPCLVLAVPLPIERPGGVSRESFATVLPPMIALIIALLDTGMDSYNLAQRLHGLDSDS
jgi:hypothetical protein